MSIPAKSDLTHVLRKGKPYSSYKDPGYDWLGKVPAHWKITRLKYLFRVVNGSTPKSTEANYWDGEIPWITPEDLGALCRLPLRFG